jgi:hypothetical protein
MHSIIFDRRFIAISYTFVSSMGSPNEAGEEQTHLEHPILQLKSPLQTLQLPIINPVEKEKKVP